MEHIKTYTKTMLKIICLAALALSLFCATTHAEEIDIKKIIKIESSGNPMAYNAKSGAIGLMQIVPSQALADYNQYHRIKYTRGQLWNPSINIKIGTWYINKRIPQMLRHYGLKDTVNNRLIAYNWGIGNLVQNVQGENQLPTETVNYIKKYKAVRYEKDT